MTATLDLWPIGNCQVSALVDRSGRFVWGCTPRVDGDPAFCSLLDDKPPAGEGAYGFWEIDLDGVVETTQSYLRNTPILVTRHTDAKGNAIEVIDFCPRFKRTGRMYRPVAFARIVRPVAGAPRIRVRLRPARNWGGAMADHTRGSNHIRYLVEESVLRLTTNAAVGWIEDERLFRVERPLHFFLGPDESFTADLVEAVLEEGEDPDPLAGPVGGRRLAGRDAAQPPEVFQAEGRHRAVAQRHAGVDPTRRAPCRGEEEFERAGVGAARRDGPGVAEMRPRRQRLRAAAGGRHRFDGALPRCNHRYAAALMNWPKDSHQMTTVP